jgi:hypothetical protein
MARIKVVSMFVILVIALGAFASTASASRRWSRARCWHTYRVWQHHHPSTRSALQAQHVRAALDTHHGCKLPLPPKAPPGALAPPTPLPAPAPSPRSTAPPATAPPGTPVTVYNVCHANPGLGPVHIGRISEGFEYPTFYWLYTATGELAFAALSTDGDPAGAVNVAFGWTIGNASTPAFFAQCSWPVWINIAVWDQEHPGSTSNGTAPLDLPQTLFEDTTPDGPDCAGPEAIDDSGLCTDDPDIDG